MAAGTETFITLLKPHYQDALKYCQALCRDRNNAADLFQQACMQAMENLARLNNAESFKAWFFKIITNTFYRQSRQSWWRIFLPLNEEEESERGPASLFEEETADTRCGLLFEALARLKPKERAAILLFEVGEFSLEEIRAIQEEASLSAIKSRLSRAREKLRQAILVLEKTNHPTDDIIQKGDVNHEAATLISRYK